MQEKTSFDGEIEVLYLNGLPQTNTSSTAKVTTSSAIQNQVICNDTYVYETYIIPSADPNLLDEVGIRARMVRTCVDVPSPGPDPGMEGFNLLL